MTTIIPTPGTLGALETKGNQAVTPLTWNEHLRFLFTRPASMPTLAIASTITSPPLPLYDRGSTLFPPSLSPPSDTTLAHYGVRIAKTGGGSKKILNQSDPSEPGKDDN
jgi:hypothetical protein